MDLEVQEDNKKKMNLTEIIKIIRTKENWNSKELINEIKLINHKKIKIDFCYIGGYELTKDGTQIETCVSSFIIIS